MKKILLSLVILGGTIFSGFAQTHASVLEREDAPKVSIGFEGGLPLGDAKNLYNAVVGGSIKYEQPIATATYVTISAGYNAFMTKSALTYLGYKSLYGFVPVKAGLKYYISGGFYAEGQGGAVFSTESGGGVAAAYSGGIGYSFERGFEAGVRYEGWAKNGTISQAGLRLAFRF